MTVKRSRSVDRDRHLRDDAAALTTRAAQRIVELESPAMNAINRPHRTPGRVSVGALLRWSLVLCFAAAAAGCSNPCTELADALCNRAGTDDMGCERWRERTARVPSETCVAGLKRLSRERAR